MPVTESTGNYVVSRYVLRLPDDELENWIVARINHNPKAPPERQFSMVLNTLILWSDSRSELIERAFQIVREF